MFDIFDWRNLDDLSQTRCRRTSGIVSTPMVFRRHGGVQQKYKWKRKQASKLLRGQEHNLKTRGLGWQANIKTLQEVSGGVHVCLVTTFLQGPLDADTCR